MNSQPRAKVFSSLLLSLLLVSMALPVQAQQRGRSGKGRAQTPARQTSEALSPQRALSINLLIETAERARSFEDLQYRTRILSLAADALWSFDEQRARQIFRRAWEAAVAADRAEQKASEEEAGIFSNSEETTFTEARDEVIRRAAARDTKLADTFLRELIGEQDKERAAESSKASHRTPWRELSTLGARRLALAYELLNRGEYNRAAQVAEPLINEGVSGDLVEFLVRLRRASARGVAPSQALYHRLAERTAADQNADANDVLLLSSYIISPSLLIVVDEKGGVQARAIPLNRGSVDQTVNNQSEAGPSKRPLYNLAVSVLLRSSFSRRAANPVQDRVARYLATGRLIPFFEQGEGLYAQFVPALRSQLATLGSEIEAGRRSSLDSQFELASLNSRNSSDPLAPQFQQLARADSPTERDRISLGITRRAAQERMWDRAQRAAYAIEDGDLRRAALSFIAVSQIADITRAYSDDKEDDFESVARFVRRAEVPPFASAWGLAQAARIAARKKDAQQQTSALLSEAESYAARLESGSRERIAAYAILTDAAARLGDVRAWDFMAELVRAVNSARDYRGDEVSLATSTEQLANEEFSEQLFVTSDAFRLDPIFATMAHLDFDKTLAQAQALTGEIPRSYARIATARAALEKKDK